MNFVTFVIFECFYKNCNLICFLLIKNITLSLIFYLLFLIFKLNVCSRPYNMGPLCWVTLGSGYRITFKSLAFKSKGKRGMGKWSYFNFLLFYFTL